MFAAEYCSQLMYVCTSMCGADNNIYVYIPKVSVISLQGKLGQLACVYNLATLN